LWNTLSEGDDAGVCGDRVLIVRGTEGSDWLAERFRAAGATVETLAVYRREDAPLDAARRHLLDGALADPTGHAWLVASVSAVDALVRALHPGRRAHRAAAALSSATAIATHPRIAAHAHDAGFGRVLLADGGFASVVRCIESADP
jgi:uroporphyrinogen-III synthase